MLWLWQLLDHGMLASGRQVALRRRLSGGFAFSIPEKAFVVSGRPIPGREWKRTLILQCLTTGANYSGVSFATCDGRSF